MAGHVVDERDGEGPRPSSPLPLPTFSKFASLHSSDEEDTKLPEHRRVTTQIMRNWAIEVVLASARGAEMLRLHRAQLFNAITRTDEDDMGHSILQKDMPDDEDYHTGEWRPGDKSGGSMRCRGHGGDAVARLDGDRASQDRGAA